MSAIEKSNSGSELSYSQSVLQALGLNVELNEGAEELNASKAGGTSWVQDPDEVLFRQFGVGKKRGAHKFLTMHWSMPDKNSNELRSQIDAVRGFILRSKNGLILWPDRKEEADGADKKRGPVCKTVRSEYGNLALTGGDRSYPFPHFYSPQAFADGPVPGVPDSDVEDVYKLIGSRGLSCAECVRRGENTDGTSYCATNSSIVMAVTEYGVERDGEISWYPITDYMGASPNGKPLYSEPVIVHMLIARTAYRKNQPFTHKGTDPESFIPQDATNFYQYANKVNSEGKVISVNSAVNPALWVDNVEMYLAQPEGPDPYTDSIPVFRSSGVDVLSSKAMKQLYQVCVAQYETALNNYVEEKNFKFGGPLDEIGPARVRKSEANITEETQVLPAAKKEVTKPVATNQKVIQVDSDDESGLQLDLTTFADD